MLDSRPHSASLTCAPRAIYAQCIEALWQCYREQPNKVQFVQQRMGTLVLGPRAALLVARNTFPTSLHSGVRRPDRATTKGGSTLVQWTLRRGLVQ